MVEIIPTSLSQPEHCFSNSQVSSYNLMFLGIKIKLTCLQDPFCVNSCRLTKTRIDLWFEDNWTRVQYNCYFLPDVNKYTEEANDAPLSPNPTVVPRVNKVIHQEHMNNPLLWVWNEPKRPTRWTNLNLMGWNLGLPSWIQLQWGEPSPSIFHSLVILNFVIF